MVLLIVRLNDIDLVLNDDEIEGNFKCARKECKGAECYNDGGRGGIGHRSIYRHVELSCV